MMAQVRRAARAGAATALKATAAAVDVVRAPRPGLVVLIYHRVGGRTPMSVDLPTEVFEDQIAWLAATLPVVALDDGLRFVGVTPPGEHVGHGEPGEPGEPGAPGGPADAPLERSEHGDHVRVAITFDDGTADFAEEAVPVLARYGVPATLYVATAFLDAGTPFPHEGVPLSWAALRDATSTGLVTVGSHTHTHALLDRLPAERVGDELDRSIESVADHLGHAPRHFAYPKAVPGSPAAEAAVRARFASAALAGGTVNVRGATDPYRLARVPLQRSDGPAWFRRKATGGLAFEETVRRVVNRARYASATT